MSGSGLKRIQVYLYIFKTREPLEQAFLEQKIDIVRIGEGPLVRLRRADAGVTPLVQQVSGGKTSIVFVAASSSIFSIEGLRGKRFAAGNRTSTSSGCKLFEIFLQAGLHEGDVALDYKENAEKNLALVAAGEYDAGVTHKEKLAASLTNYFRILLEFPTTTMPWAARKGLPLSVSRAFTGALCAITDKRILRRLPDDATLGFKPADTNFFRVLDRHMQQVEEEFFHHRPAVVTARRSGAG